MNSKVNPGKNNKGQRKRGLSRSGPTPSTYIEDAKKRHDSVYKRKTTILKKAKERHLTSKSEILIIVKSASGKMSTYATPYFEDHMQRIIKSPPSNVPSAPPSVITTSISSSSSITTNCSSSTSAELISTPHCSTSSIPPILSLNALSPQPSLASPSPSFPSPQPTFLPPITNSKSGEKEKRSDGYQTSKKRRIVVCKTKCTQTETITTKVPETCNVCLTTQERGHWVGCDRARCGYWVHDECMGFYFSSNTIVKKTKFRCPIHR